MPIEHGWFRTDPHICQPEFTHAIAEINPAEGAESLTCDLVLDPGTTRAGDRGRPRRQAPGGLHRHQPLPRNDEPQHGQAHRPARSRAIALDPKQPRPLFFRHDEKKLAAVVMAKGDESGPLTVRLQPAGTVTGRLIDDDGQPRSRRQDQCQLWKGSVRPRATTGPS